MAGIKFSTVDALQPAIAWRYKLTLPTFSDNAQGSDPSVITVRKPPVSDFACAFTVNPRTISTDSSYVAASHRAFPTEYGVEAFTIRFIENKDFGVMRFFRAWQRRVITPEGYFGLPKDYKRPIIIEPLDTKGQTAVKLTYADCWPTGLASFDLDGTQTGFVMQTVTMACDNADEPE